MPFPKNQNNGKSYVLAPIPPKSTESRPYRSHKIPACDRCRKRKLRCIVDKPGEKCHLCRNSGAICAQARSKTKSNSDLIRLSLPFTGLESEESRTNHPRKHHRFGNDVNCDVNSTASTISKLQVKNSTYVPHRSLNAQAESVGNKSRIVVGPVLAEDVAMVEKHMSTIHDYQEPSSGHIYDTVSDNPQDPILYLTVPRRRQGLSNNSRPGDAQREILEQMLGPLLSEVISLYFKYIHPAFPVLDEEQFICLHKTEPTSLSSALVCDIIASSLIYWHRSPSLNSHSCPDLRYVWNLAVAALQEEFLAPGMSTAHAVLLDLGGRPTTSIVGNSMSSGRAVALSNILGLNRDPSTWKISEAEKDMRVRLWWGILIHDRWSSFAHGVPAHIAKNQYEVHLPSLDSIVASGMNTVARVESGKCFLALCTLTEILGDILPLVYNRHQRAGIEIDKVIRRLEIDLDQWEDSLIAKEILKEREKSKLVSGSSSLKLGFLSAKLLLRRIAFRNNSLSSDETDIRQYSQAMLREAARQVTTFMCSLESEHLSEFWLPYSAYHLASATIILMRCAIETHDPLIAESCKESLTNFMQWLRQAKDVENWDLADICLSQCERPIAKMYSSVGDYPNSVQYHDTQISHEISGNMNAPPVGVNDGFDPAIFSFSDYCNGTFTGASVTDTQHSVNGFEYPWADLWDMFSK